jgi:hypothetical protein
MTTRGKKPPLGGNTDGGSAPSKKQGSAKAKLLKNKVKTGGARKPAKNAPKKPDIKGPRTKEKVVLQETNPVGRPTKFTPEVIGRIIQSLQAGNYIETAAAFAGIDKTTLYDWLKQGAAEDEGEYRNFSNAVGEALATAEMLDVQRVGNAAKDDWRAAAWRLERRHSKRWCRKDHIEVAKPRLEDLGDEELLALLQSRDTEGN